MSRSSSSIRLKARLFSAAASRAISASPARSTRGTRRSSAAISSRSSRTAWAGVTAMNDRRANRSRNARHSRSRRRSCSGSSCQRLDSSPSSRSMSIGRMDTSLARWTMLTGPRRNLSWDLPGRALVRAKAERAAELRKAGCDASSIRRRESSGRNTQRRRFLYIEPRNPALSPPASEQCSRPSCGCAPTGPFRPSIGVSLKNPSNVDRSADLLHSTGRLRLRADRESNARAGGVSRWRALEHKQFRALTAAPRRQSRSKGDITSC